MSKEILQLDNDLTVKATSYAVDRIRLKEDGSGDWVIRATVTTSNPERQDVENINLSERHTINARIIVTRQDIADQAGIDVDDVRSTLTLEQTETHATAVAVGKLNQVFGW